MIKFAFPFDEITEENLESFLKDFENNNLINYYREKLIET
jgi:hypothetical protein